MTNGLGLGLAFTQPGAGSGDDLSSPLAFVNGRQNGGYYIITDAQNGATTQVTPGQTVELWNDQSEHNNSMFGDSRHVGIIQQGVLLARVAQIGTGVSFIGVNGGAPLSEVFEEELGENGTIVFFYVNQTGAWCYNFRPGGSKHAQPYSLGHFPGVDAIIWGWALGTVTPEQAEIIKASLWAASGLAARHDIVLDAAQKLVTLSGGAITNELIGGDADAIGTEVSVIEAGYGVLSPLSPPWVNDPTPTTTFDTFSGDELGLDFYAETAADLACLHITATYTGQFDAGCFTVRADLPEAFQSLEALDLHDVEGELLLDGMSPNIEVFRINGHTGIYGHSSGTLNGPAPDFSASPFADSLEALVVRRTGMHGTLNASGTSLVYATFSHSDDITGIDVSDNPDLSYLTVNLLGIETLDISNTNAANSFSGFDGGDFEHLKVINASNCYYGSSVATFFDYLLGNAPNVEELDFSDNILSGADVNISSSGDVLRRVNFSNTDISECQIFSDAIEYVNVENTEDLTLLRVQSTDQSDIDFRLEGCAASYVNVVSYGQTAFQIGDLQNVETFYGFFRDGQYGVMSDLDISTNESLYTLYVQGTALESFSTAGAISLDGAFINYDSEITTAALSTDSPLTRVAFVYCPSLTSVNGVDDQPNLIYFNSTYTGLSDAALSQIVVDIESHGTSYGDLRLLKAGGWTPSVEAEAAKTSLEGRSWTVYFT